MNKTIGTPPCTLRQLRVSVNTFDKYFLMEIITFTMSQSLVFPKNLEKVKHMFFFKQTKTKFTDHKSENVRSSVFLIRSNAHFQIFNHKILFLRV